MHKRSRFRCTLEEPHVAKMKAEPCSYGVSRSRAVLFWDIKPHKVITIIDLSLPGRKKMLEF